MAAKKKAATPKLDSIAQAASALPKEAVQRLSFDPLEAKKAVSTGLKALEKYKAQLKRSYAGFDLAALAALPDIAERLRLAQRDVQQAGAPKNAVALAQAALGHRRDLLAYAQSLARRGEVDAKALAKIERGAGQTDNLQDIVELVTLLNPVEARVEAAFEPGILATANSAARDALSAHGSGKDDLSNLTETRDRLATLVLRGHERLRLALAVVTSLNEAMTRVPPLRSTRPTTAPAPVPPAA